MPASYHIFSFGGSSILTSSSPSCSRNGLRSGAGLSALPSLSAHNFARRPSIPVSSCRLCRRTASPSTHRLIHHATVSRSRNCLLSASFTKSSRLSSLDDGPAAEALSRIHRVVWIWNSNARTLLVVKSDQECVLSHPLSEFFPS